MSHWPALVSVVHALEMVSLQFPMHLSYEYGSYEKYVYGDLSTSLKPVEFTDIWSLFYKTWHFQKMKKKCVDVIELATYLLFVMIKPRRNSQHLNHCFISHNTYSTFCRSTVLNKCNSNSVERFLYHQFHITDCHMFLHHLFIGFYHCDMKCFFFFIKNIGFPLKRISESE